jgi:hypothetical protein
VFASPVSQDKTGNSGAIVKSSNELAKTTPAGEYLTSALMDFDPDQFEGFAAIADGANKLLMLVINTTPTYIILLLDLLYLLFVATKLVLLLPLYCPRLPLYIFFLRYRRATYHCTKTQMHPQPQNSTAITFVPGTESGLTKLLTHYLIGSHLTELSPYC